MESISSNQLNLDWTAEISSPKMISISPKNEEESCQFLAYTALLCKVYLKTAEISEPILSPEKVEKIQAGHEKCETSKSCFLIFFDIFLFSRFLKKSVENTHLREIIERGFGPEVMEDYLSNCFFAKS